MNSIFGNIYKAITEHKLLYIEYENYQQDVHSFWFGVEDIDVEKGVLYGSGLQLSKMNYTKMKLYVKGIRQARVLKTTRFSGGNELIGKMLDKPGVYEPFFGNETDLKLFSYLTRCYELDTTPFLSSKEYFLSKNLDISEIQNKKNYRLSDKQFESIVRKISHIQEKQEDKELKTEYTLAMNELSIHVKNKGVYPLVYRELLLDSAEKALSISDEVSINYEFCIGDNEGDTVANENKKVVSARFFLEEDELNLLVDFEKNRHIIADLISKKGKDKLERVDERPYIFAFGRQAFVDLASEYETVISNVKKQTAQDSVMVFAGIETTKRSRRNQYALCLENESVDLDQIMALHNGMTTSITKVQGPPGSGKTTTIVNTILTAFFNDRKVLFSSMNNVPIDVVYNKLKALPYKDYIIPFPVLRLGNKEKIINSIVHIRNIFKQVDLLYFDEEEIRAFKKENKDRSKQVIKILFDNEERKAFENQKEVFLDLINKGDIDAAFGKSLIKEVKRLEKKIDKIPCLDAGILEGLINKDRDRLFLYLNYLSAQRFLLLTKEKYRDIGHIFLKKTPIEEAATDLSNYIKEDRHLHKLLEVFPVIITTNIGTSRLGTANCHFDLSIIDEAGQCNLPLSVPAFARGKQLMLVGDPQQLSPVILMNEQENKLLMEKYHIPESYNFVSKSIYTCFADIDHISREILLHNHYRCHKKIVGFANEKYYNGQLEVCNKLHEKASVEPLIFVDVKNSRSAEKNTSMQEVGWIIDYVKKNKGKRIGIITPFRAQETLISASLKGQGIENVDCGTVHSFQGEQRDIIILSTAVNNHTGIATYQWLRKNKELIVVASTRAVEQLVILTNENALGKLHIEATKDDRVDDWYEFMEYVKSNGKIDCVTQIKYASEVFGASIINDDDEKHFVGNLNHAISIMKKNGMKVSLSENVSPAEVLPENIYKEGLFSNLPFSAVVYKDKKPVIIMTFEELEEKSDKEKRKNNRVSHLKEVGISYLEIPRSYSRRYQYLKEQIEKAI